LHVAAITAAQLRTAFNHSGNKATRRPSQNSQQAAGSSQTARQPGQKLSHAMAKRAEFS